MISPRAYRLIGMYTVSNDGRSWYDDQPNGPLGWLARRYGLTYERVAAIFSVLSPNITWRQCYTSTEKLLMQRGRAPSEIRGVSGYGQNVRKAARILAGARPEEVVSGPKVEAFYRALLGEEVLVIDVHVINAWKGETATVTDVRLTERDRRELTRDYYEAARAVGEPSIRAFQARVWNEQRKQRDMQKNPEQRVIVAWE